jgi:hypothetical protein
MKTTVRVPIINGVGAIVISADSEEDSVLISIGDGNPCPVKGRELLHAVYILSGAVKPDNDPNLSGGSMVTATLRPRY